MRQHTQLCTLSVPHYCVNVLVCTLLIIQYMFCFLQQDNSASAGQPPLPQAAPRTAPRTAPAIPPVSSDPASIIRTLHDQYKSAALAAKRGGDREQAVLFLRTMKKLEPMLTAAVNGQPVDLTTLPGPPSASHTTSPTTVSSQCESSC